MPMLNRQEIDENLLRHLACGGTEDSAARAAGVHIRTVQRRLAKPAFQKRLEGYRADVPRRRDALLDAGAIESIKTLLALQKESIPPPVRFKAAQCLLTNSVQRQNRSEREARAGAAAGVKDPATETRDRAKP